MTRSQEMRQLREAVAGLGVAIGAIISEKLLTDEAYNDIVEHCNQKEYEKLFKSMNAIYDSVGLTDER